MNEYWLYYLFNNDSDISFLDFIVAIYEIPKRCVDLSLSRSEKKRVREEYERFFEVNKLEPKTLQSVRDCYVHRITFVGDLYVNLESLDVHSVMSYVRYFKLEISAQEILERKVVTLNYLKGLCDVFGYLSVGDAVRKDKRFLPFSDEASG